MAVILVSGIAATFYNTRRHARAAAAVDERPIRSQANFKDPMHTTLISAADLAACIDDPNWVVLDCRHDLMNPAAGRAAYAAGHIPARCSPTSSTNCRAQSAAPTASSAAAIRCPSATHSSTPCARWGVNDDTQVVAYDAHGGMFAARLWWMLRWVGHEAVAVLDGGLPAWQALDLPLSTEAPVTAARRIWSSAIRWSRPVDADEVLANIGSRARTVVDARAPDRFRGENETIDPVGGHIPGAKNRFFKDNLQADGRFKPADQLKAEFARAGRSIRQRPSCNAARA